MFGENIFLLLCIVGTLKIITKNKTLKNIENFFNQCSQKKIIVHEKFFYFFIQQIWSPNM